MAKLQVCAIRDVALEAYNRPFFAQSLGMAVRLFEDEVNRSAPDNPMSNHPSDFSLWHLGVFDEESGRFEMLDNPLRLSDASSVVFLKGGGNDEAAKAKGGA